MGHEQAQTSVRTCTRSSSCLSSFAGSVQTLAPPCPTHTQLSIKVVSSEVLNSAGCLTSVPDEDSTLEFWGILF